MIDAKEVDLSEIATSELIDELAERDIYVDAEIDLAEVSMQDLRAELEARDDYVDSEPPWERIYSCIALGDNDSAMQIIRAAVQEKLGRVLP
jgi:hypothetical protein